MHIIIYSNIEYKTQNKQKKLKQANWPHRYPTCNTTQKKKKKLNMVRLWIACALIHAKRQTLI